MKDTKIFNSPDGKKLIAIQIEQNSWDLKEYREPVILTEEEQRKAVLLHFDLEKVLKVKQYLIEGFTPSDIEKKFKVSRTSVYNYQKVLSVKYSKKQKKDNENTENIKNVNCNLLIISFLGIENTELIPCATYYLIFVLFIAYLKYKYDLYFREQMEHKKEAARVHLLFTKVFDLTYDKYPIYVRSKKEYDHFRKLLKHYNNESRFILFLEHSHSFDEKEKWINDFCASRRLLIKHSKETKTEIWKKLEENGYFDFWKTPKGKHWRKSKEWLYNAIKFYEENQENYLKETARKKHIIDDLIFEEIE